MGKSVCLFHLKISVFGRKSTGTVIVMDKTIYSDLEALLIFMPVKWVVNSAECFYKRRVFGMTLVITGLLI